HRAPPHRPAAAARIRSRPRHVPHHDQRVRDAHRCDRRARGGRRQARVTWWIPAAYAGFLGLLVYRYATRRPRLADWPPQTSGALVSVIVPARNEAVNVEACIRSIVATAYRPLEVIVVDDRSTDGTAAIVERLAGVRLVRGAELQPGWFGKQGALVQGYRQARGERTLFVAAEPRQEPRVMTRSGRVRAAKPGA